MPKRTNDFQQLIHLIYQQIAPLGATVQESALLTERNSSTQREVDILIERDMVGVTMRIAVECRDRGRKSDVEWIDSLIGKFKDLPIHQVIAVSKLGFSQAAREKAAANNIEIRTLEQALHTDWPEQFMRQELWQVIRYTDVLRVDIETTPPLAERPLLDSIVVNEEGEVCGSLKEITADCRVRIVDPAIGALTDEHGLELLEKLGKRGEALFLTIKTKANNIYLRQEDGPMYRIVSLIFQTSSRFDFVPVELQSYIYQDVQV